MKKIAIVVIIGILLLMLPTGAMALKSPVSLYVNGHKVVEELPVMFLDQQLYVPVELIAGHLGLISEWNEQTQSGIVKRADGSKKLEYAVHLASPTVDGERISASGTVQLGEDNLPFIPIRWIEQMTGMKVLWDVLTRSVFIFISGEPVVPIETPVGENDSAGESVIMLPEDIEQNRTKVVVSGFRLGDAEAAISLSGPVDSSSFYISGEEEGIHDRIVIDIPNSRLAEKLLDANGREHGVYPVEHRYIQQIRYSLFDAETSTIRFVFDLKQKTSFQQVQNYQTNELIIAFTSNTNDQAAYTIVLDPGHGGHDPGTVGASGQFEKDYTLPLAFKIKHLLEQDSRVKVLLTREEDQFVSLEERAKFANDAGAGLFVSLHGNSFDGKTRGTETFYYGKDSEPFAEVLHEFVSDATKFRDRGMREEKYRVLNLTKMPGALLEIGYLDHPEEEKVMLSTEFLDRVAKAISDGIIRYLDEE